MNREELRVKIEELGPWHYNQLLPYEGGKLSTGDSPIEEVHPKLAVLLKAGAFARPRYPKVLDLGANSGLISMWFADNKGSTVTALEFGAKYYPQLELAVELKGYTGRVIPKYEDICDCNFGKGYDLVLFLGTLHHLLTGFHMPVLQACRKALLPGGEIVLQTKPELDIPGLLEKAGFVNLVHLPNDWGTRDAYAAMKDPMKTYD